MKWSNEIYGKKTINKREPNPPLPKAVLGSTSHPIIFVVPKEGVSSFIPSSSLSTSKLSLHRGRDKNNVEFATSGSHIGSDPFVEVICQKGGESYEHMCSSFVTNPNYVQKLHLKKATHNKMSLSVDLTLCSRLRSGIWGIYWRVFEFMWGIGMMLGFGCGFWGLGFGYWKYGYWLMLLNGLCPAYVTSNYLRVDTLHWEQLEWL